MKQGYNAEKRFIRLYDTDLRLGVDIFQDTLELYNLKASENLKAFSNDQFLSKVMSKLKNKNNVHDTKNFFLLKK